GCGGSPGRGGPRRGGDRWRGGGRIDRPLGGIYRPAYGGGTYGMILERIIAAKREEVAGRRRAAPVSALRDRPLYGAPRRPFGGALAAAPAPAVIAELKRASPSRGTIRSGYDEAELAWAAAAGATLIGINNRDLGSFAVTLATTERLAPRAPAGALVVAESGIRSPADLHRMLAAGARAVLVGEAFMERPDPGGALAEWLCR